MGRSAIRVSNLPPLASNGYPHFRSPAHLPGPQLEFQPGTAWLDSMDNAYRSHCAILLQMTTLNASEGSLKSLIGAISARALKDFDRDKIDFLLVQYLPCAPQPRSITSVLSHDVAE